MKNGIIIIIIIIIICRMLCIIWVDIKPFYNTNNNGISM